jgi:hypothetical protein
LVAPATAVHENCGSNISVAVIRSFTAGVVVDGHDQLNEETGDCDPLLPSESSGVTAQ